MPTIARMVGAACIVAVAALLSSPQESRASAAATPASASRAPVKFVPGFTLGDRARYTLKATTTIEQAALEGEEAPVKRSYSQELRFRVTVVETSEPRVDDAPAATLTIAPEHLVLERSFPEPERVEIVESDLDSPENEDPAPPMPDNADATAGTLAPLARVYLSCAMRAEIARDGSVIRLSGLERVSEAASSRDDALALGHIAPGLFERTLERLFRVDEPSRDGSWSGRSPGEEWSVSRRLVIPGAGPAREVTRWTLEAVDASSATLTSAVTTTLAGAGAKEDHRLAPGVRSTAAERTGRTTWDLPGSRASIVDETGVSTTAASIAGRSRETTVRTELHIERIEAPPAPSP